MRVAVLLMMLVVVGCAPAQVHFQPYGGHHMGYRPEVSPALWAYDQDIPALARAGGSVIGTLVVQRGGFATANDNYQTALVEGARYGGTHIMLASQVSEVGWTQVTPVAQTTTTDAYGRTTTYSPGIQIRDTAMRAGYIVVRVPPEWWLALPPHLRPIPGRHFMGTYVPMGPPLQPVAPQPVAPSQPVAPAQPAAPTN